MAIVVTVDAVVVAAAVCESGRTFDAVRQESERVVRIGKSVAGMAGKSDSFDPGKNGKNNLKTMVVLRLFNHSSHFMLGLFLTLITIYHLKNHMTGSDLLTIGQH